MENEMIADIVAEKRRLADEREKSLGDQHSYVETLRFDADRIEAAWKREKSQSWHHREMEELILRHEKEVAELKKLIPQPDPDWKAICEKCHDGEIEPKCEYDGEPNGCNSPIYGEHPKASLGNNPAMREALATVIKIAAEMRGEYEIADSILKDGWATQLESIAKAALSIPARNCDVGTSEEQSERYDEFCNIHDCRSDCPLFKADSCEFAWAQMPYEAQEGGEE